MDVMTSAIETVVKIGEKIDTGAASRPVVYGAAHQQASTEETAALATTSNLDKLKVVSGELLDLWLFEGSRGLEYLKASQAYKLTDPYVNYIAKFEQVKDSSLKVSTQLQKTLPDVLQQVMLFVDEGRNFVGLLLKVLTERQEHLIEYILKTYSNVTVFVQDNFMRLDFNGDGKVDMDDMRKSLTELYTFLKNYDYIEATQRIKSTVYEEAHKYMKSADRVSDAEQQKIVEAGDIPISEE